MYTVLQTDEFQTWLDELTDKRAQIRISARLRLAEAGNLGDWASYLHGKGQKIDFKGISIVRVKDGKIVYQANYFDTQALGQQAGW